MSTWLSKELQERGWSMRELARKVGKSHTAIADIVNEQMNPSPEMCRLIADALSLPPERVFRMAGLLPPRIIGGENEHRKTELLDYFEALDERGRDTALAMLRTLYEQRGPYVAELKPNKED